VNRTAEALNLPILKSDRRNTREKRIVPIVRCGGVAKAQLLQRFRHHKIATRKTIAPF
jgi:hypothetical protein